MESEDDEQSFAETVLENLNLAKIYHPLSEIPQLFLRRDDRIFVRSVAVDEAEREAWLHYSFDIDGCVLELNSLEAITMPVRHITLLPKENASLRELRSVLKKHIDLTEYSKSELMTFCNSVGFQLFYERGWECWIGLIPIHQRNSVALSNVQTREQTANFVKYVREKFKAILVSLALRGEASRTLQKNDINNVSRLFLLPDDSSTILKSLQASINQVSPTGNMRPIMFCFRFGEKMTSGLSLSDFNLNFLTRTTLHVAVDISTDGDVDLLWSTAGLQEIIGLRGTLTTCLSFADCGNFQSNLDGRAMDIKNMLRNCCVFPDQVQFIQLYADLPHRRPSCRYHPVSACIVGGMCFPRSTADALHKDADHYVSTLESNFMLMRNSSCRLEFVLSQDTLSSNHLYSQDFFVLKNLEELLEKVPLLSPLPPQTLKCIRHLGLWICRELREMLREFQGTGNVRCTWQSFQLELACEKILWGQPLCSRSTKYSINLGPGCLTPSRSVTDQFGFLSLDLYSTSMQTERSIPPPEIWTQSGSVCKMILRSVGLHDHLDASFGVIGRHLLIALLHDFHEIGKAACYVKFEDFLREMQSVRTKFKTIGAVTLDSLVKLLKSKRRSDTHMVFPKLCQIVEKSGLQLEDVLQAGFQELLLKHFPAVKTYDRHGNMTLTWSFHEDFWGIISNEQSSKIDLETQEMMSELVRGDLEKRGLIYPSRLKNTPKILPWMSICLHRLKRETLQLEPTVTVMSYISCIAFIMQDWYVEYERLPPLVADLPIDRNRLIALEILSKLQLSKLNLRNVHLNRLHFTVPHKMDVKMTGAVKKHTGEMVDSDLGLKGDVATEETQRNIGQDDELLVFDRNIGPQRSINCRPITKLQSTWSGQEIEFLHQVCCVEGLTIPKKYELFRSKCFNSNIPVRTFRAFECKLRRI
jgi:hypothetical protein